MRTKALIAVSVPAVVLGVYCLWPTSSPEAPANPVAAAAPAAKPEAPPELVAQTESVDLALACEEKRIVAEFVGNGRDRMKVMLLNKSGAPLHITVAVGQMFESDHNSVLTVRPGGVDVEPGRTRELALETVAIHSSNNIGNLPYELSYANVPRLEPLLTLVQSRPELASGAIQTAILAICENLPLSSFAKFTLASNPLPSRYSTDAFRADTVDIIQALSVLRELKVKDESLALTIDPQLKIEAMIDPNARPVAMRYYAIDPEREWDFWRNELLNGEPCTRHYALFGIARFYPDVALAMLPSWARETRTNPVYRLSAVQALADTQRSEALPILRQLATDLGLATELGKAATGAADYLDYRLAQIASLRSSLAFHNTAKNQPESF